MIRAEVHSDDYRKKATFDASKWFEEASDEEILALAACDFGGDYPADAVAEWFSDSNPNVSSVLDWAADHDECGFECHVDESQAMAWLKKHRRALWLTLNDER